MATRAQAIDLPLTEEYLRIKIRTAAAVLFFLFLYIIVSYKNSEVTTYN